MFEQAIPRGLSKEEIKRTKDQIRRCNILIKEQNKRKGETLFDNQIIVQKLVEAGLEEKHALLIIDMASQPPAKASEIGKEWDFLEWMHIIH